MQSVPVAGGNCYSLAAQYLNDATQFIRIMQLNGLTDPVLPATVQTILIPDINPNLTGGVPSQ